MRNVPAHISIRCETYMRKSELMKNSNSEKNYKRNDRMEMFSEQGNVTVRQLKSAFEKNRRAEIYKYKGIKMRPLKMHIFRRRSFCSIFTMEATLCICIYFPFYRESIR